MQRLGKGCFEPVDKLAASALDLLDDTCFDDLCRLCASGLVGAAGAAPPCSSFSRARLRPRWTRPGAYAPAPYGYPACYPQPSTGTCPVLSAERSRYLLSLVSSRGGLIWLENPSSSLLWLDPVVLSWVRTNCPHLATVAACRPSPPEFIQF